MHLEIRNESARKRFYRRDVLARIAERIWAGERLRGQAEVSLLLCDNARIRELNRTYREKDTPTDVLSFAQESDEALPIRLLGDIVISLETVERNCAEPDAVRREVRLLFCHGMLHLLGYTHDTAPERKRMAAKQAEYLCWPLEAAWPSQPAHSA